MMYILSVTGGARDIHYKPQAPQNMYIEISCILEPKRFKGAYNLAAQKITPAETKRTKTKPIP
jgi:hypothetical protein